MESREINEPGIWNNFLENKEPTSGSFLQSWEWGEFQEAYGRKIYRLGIYEQEELQGTALIIKYPLPLGKSYLYCPKGPVVQDQRSKIEDRRSFINLLFTKLKEIDGTENSIFFRLEPEKDLPVTGYKLRITKSVQPADTLILDLEKDEETLLNEMKSKTRYNIRLAQKKGVSIRESTREQDLEIFLKLLKDTATRDNFNPHPDNYYRKMLEVLGKKEMVKLSLAEFKGKIIGANLLIFFNGLITYLHGALDYHYRDVMAPYLLHWEAIRQAKQQGLKGYDFWGIAPDDNSSHPWAGITRFKKGFGGKEFHYAGTFDFAFNKFWYQLYRMGRKVKSS